MGNELVKWKQRAKLPHLDHNSDWKHSVYMFASCDIYVRRQQQPTCRGPHPLDNGDQRIISSLGVLLLKSADAGLSNAIRGMSMEIELEDDCSYEIFTFIPQPVRDFRHM